MKIKRIFILSVLLLSLMAMACGSKNENSNEVLEIEELDAVVEDDAEESETEVYTEMVSNGKPSIIDFNATWCGPCKIMKPIFHKLAKEYSDRYNFISIDVDKNKDLAEKYAIEVIPVFVFVDAEGKEGKRIVGSVEESVIRTELDNPKWF